MRGGERAPCSVPLPLLTPAGSTRVAGSGSPSSSSVKWGVKSKGENGAQSRLFWERHSQLLWKVLSGLYYVRCDVVICPAGSEREGNDNAARLIKSLTMDNPFRQAS